MKKILFSALAAIGLLSVASTANAQKLSLDELPPYKLGITAGMNASSFSHAGFDGKFGFHAGVNALFDASGLLENTFVRTELLFQRKGATVGDHTKFRTCYLELPVHYGYAYGINNDWTIFGETGPYFAIGLGGRVRWDYEDVIPDPMDGDKYIIVKEKGSEKFFSNGDDDPSNFDTGWGLHVGAIFQQNHQISIGWDWGFINMNDGLLQNRNFMVSYTYYIM
ncbi:MAG: porin family protein [Bacteroidales bacterium]|nr:porin family protein [Candidatus Liminaster caballi]